MKIFVMPFSCLVKFYISAIYLNFNFKAFKLLSKAKTAWQWKYKTVIWHAKFEPMLWRHDIQHNDIQYNDIQHNDIQHNDIQHNDIQHNEIQHNDIQHNNK